MILVPLSKPPVSSRLKLAARWCAKLRVSVGTRLTRNARKLPSSPLLRPVMLVFASLFCRWLRKPAVEPGSSCSRSTPRAKASDQVRFDRAESAAYCRSLFAMPRRACQADPLRDRNQADRRQPWCNGTGTDDAGSQVAEWRRGR